MIQLADILLQLINLLIHFLDDGQGFDQLGIIWLKFVLKFIHKGVELLEIRLLYILLFLSILLNYFICVLLKHGYPLVELLLELFQLHILSTA